MSSAVLVQTNGLGFSFVASRNALMSRSSCLVDPCDDRLSFRRVRTENQHSTRLIHEVYANPVALLICESRTHTTSRPLKNSGAAEIERGFVLTAPTIRRHIRVDTSRIGGAVRAEARRSGTVGVF